MKKLLHLISFEIKVVICSKFHLVLLITLAAVIGTYYLLPDGESDPPQFEEAGLVEVHLLDGDDSLGLREEYLMVMLSFEVAILGFLFVAVTMFNEKEEGVIKSYRVSPSSSFVYVLAKVLTWTFLSTLYGIIFLIATKRTGYDQLSLLLLIMVSTCFMTTLGLFVAIFFKNMSDWFFAGVGALVLNMLPQLKFTFSSFDPFWFKIIPGYYMSKGFQDILTNSNRESWGIITGLFIITFVLFFITLITTHLKLMKEGN